MTKRPITVDDLTKLRFVGTPKISPNEHEIVYTLTESDTELNGYKTSLWQINTDQDPKPLTTYQVKDRLIKDNNPTWSPNGEYIYFLSNRTEKQQVWRIPVNGGEAQQITNFEEGANHFVLSPDGQQLVCEISVPEKNQIEEDNEDVVVIERLRYMGNGAGFIKNYTHLYLFDLSTKEATQLTSGLYNARSPWFIPNGDSIIYLKSRETPEENGYFSDIYSLDLSTKVETTLYTGKGFVYDLQVSSDGSYVSFIGHEGGEISPDNASIWIFPLSNPSDVTNLTKNWDRPVGNYVGADTSFDGGLDYKWAADNQSLTFISTVGGDTVLKKVTLNGELSDITINTESVITSFDQVGDTLTLVRTTPVAPGEVFVLTDNNLKQLTNHNESLLNEVELSEPQGFTYKGADDWDIEGWILFPPKAAKVEGKIPVVLQIHGGPHTAYGNALHHEFQSITGQGYAVVYTNPRGSQGYGRAFTAACIGDWGKKDQEDILIGLDYALNHYDELDKERQFVTGGSYGGFMTNTIITCTDRFKAAVTQRCISNMYSFFGTSDIGYYFAKGQLGNADLWEDEDAVLEVSPIRHARNVRTPTCIIHSEEDLRCPMEQAEQWYVALRRLGVETRFVRFKGETHELSRSGKPKNRLTRLNEIIGWFNKYNMKK